MNPWTLESRIEYCKDRAAHNGFRLEPGDGNNTIKIVADTVPYGKDVVIARLYDWSLVEMFFLGYEQDITHPPEWQGLTGEELRNIAREFKGNTQRRFEDHWDEIVAFIREAEAKLKEKNT